MSPLSWLSIWSITESGCEDKLVYKDTIAENLSVASGYHYRLCVYNIHGFLIKNYLCGPGSHFAGPRDSLI